MTTVESWRVFRRKWSEEVLQVDGGFPAEVKENRWLGYEPATEEQIHALEMRLGYRLAPSYRAFLLTTNGWRRTSSLIQRIRPVEEVDWLESLEPWTVDGWTRGASLEPLEGYPPEEYFAYDGRPIYDQNHFRQSLKIADPADGDTMMYLLNPLVVAEDGEWEAWRHAHWIPGAERFPSFAELMLREYAVFRTVELEERTELGGPGPYAGVYAPDHPRHEAERIGPGAPRPRRYAVSELVVMISDPDAKVRRRAAELLIHQCGQYDPASAHREWIKPLTEVLRSGLEAEVRQAAAVALPTFGGVDAVAVLGEVVHESQIAVFAIGALQRLAYLAHDPVIGEVAYEYLSRSSDPSVLDMAMQILESYGDERVGMLALQIAEQRPVRHVLDRAMRLVGKSHPHAIGVLRGKLRDLSPEVRGAAVAALAQAPAPLVEDAIRSALKDPDVGVRVAAARSLRAMHRSVQISPADEKELRQREEQMMREYKEKVRRGEI